MFFYLYALNEVFSLLPYRTTYKNGTINLDDQRGKDVYDNPFLELTEISNIIKLNDRKSLCCAVLKSFIWMCQIYRWTMNPPCLPDIIVRKTAHNFILVTFFFSPLHNFVTFLFLILYVFLGKSSLSLKKLQRSILENVALAGK